MTKKYDVYALGNALVDTEIEVSDAFLERMDVGKGLMTLVDEARQAELIEALANEAEPRKQTSGGSACNTVVATRYFGGNSYYACKVPDDATGNILVDDLTAAIKAADQAGLQVMNEVVRVKEGAAKGAKAAYLRDRDGIIVEMIQRPK